VGIMGETGRQVGSQGSQPGGKTEYPGAGYVSGGVGGNRRKKSLANCSQDKHQRAKRKKAGKRPRGKRKVIKKGLWGWALGQGSGWGGKVGKKSLGNEKRNMVNRSKEIRVTGGKGLVQAVNQKSWGADKPTQSSTDTGEIGTANRGGQGTGQPVGKKQGKFLGKSRVRGLSGGSRDTPRGCGEKKQNEYVVPKKPPKDCKKKTKNPGRDQNQGEKMRTRLNQKEGKDRGGRGGGRQEEAKTKGPKTGII